MRNENKWHLLLPKEKNGHRDFLKTIKDKGTCCDNLYFSTKAVKFWALLPRITKWPYGVSCLLVYNIGYWFIYCLPSHRSVCRGCSNGNRMIYEKAPKSHYSKSQIFVQKFNFDKTPTFSRGFHPKFFWQLFSWNQSCQKPKKPKTTTFSRLFHPKKSTNYSGNQSWIFGQKLKISNSVKAIA